MRRVLVTGGAGFIGSAVVRRLLRETTDQVLTVDLLTYAGSLDTLSEVEGHPRHAFQRADIADAAAMRALVSEFRPQAVLHLAAESHVDRSIDGPAAFLHTNVVGTFTLLQEALRYWRTLPPGEAEGFRFLHVSTDEVFGSLGAEGLFDEETPYRPSSPYAATKASADHLARAWHRTYGLPILTTNCSNNYGPFQFPEKLIPLMIRSALAERPLPVYGTGENIRDWLYVEDHAEALLTVLARGRPGETYGVSARSERRNLEVVRSLCATLDALRPPADGRPRSRLITLVEDRPGHDQRYAIDPGKLERELGWRPRMGFEEGLKETVAWYLAHEAWCAKVESQGYRGERLGLGGRA